MKRATLLLPLVLAFGCATVAPTTVPPDARAELAPTGKLRVGLIAASPLFVTQNTPPGVTRGVAVDIARELAARIGVPMEPMRYPSTRALAESAGKDEWDVAFLVIDPERAEVMNFTAAYMYNENEAPIGMAVARKRPAAYAYAYQFIGEMNASGAVREAIAREGLIGVRAAPAR